MAVGEALVAAKLVTADDVALALSEQKQHGGTLGDNLVRLGRIDRARLEEFLEQGPPKLRTLRDTGLDESFLQNLALKVMYLQGAKTASDLAGVLRLSTTMVRELLEGLRARGLLEPLGAEHASPQFGLRYGVSGTGRDWARESLRQSEYAGPAPVSLSAWQAQVQRQRITNDRLDQASIVRALQHLVLAPELIARLGPAVNAGRGLLLYGAPGDGKTSIATAIARSFKHSVWIPYAVEVEGEIIRIFDPAVHKELAPPAESASLDDELLRPSMRLGVSSADRRWVHCARPVLIIGGELTMEMLDLKFERAGRYYEAPLHVRATGGVLVIDDFGRQVARPEQVLNRWVLPLEARLDYLTLHTGKKFPVTFDGLVIFSTNLTPHTIMDAAMIRRIPYNFHIAPPTGAEYIEIFKRVCAAAGLPFQLETVKTVMKWLYIDQKLALARFHPRFIVEHVLARCSYEGREPVLSDELALDAADHLFTKQ